MCVCVCVYICIYKIHVCLHRDCIWNTVARIPKGIGCGTYLHKPGAVRSVDWTFIIGASAWRWVGEYVTLDKTFLQSPFQTGSIISVSYLQIFFLAVFFEEVFIRNVINMLIKKCIIVMCINDDNAVINDNNYRRLFRIPMGTRKDFFESFKQFRHVPS
jgi:hypothetical protein